MRDAAIILLIVAVGILGYFVHSMSANLADQQRQISDLTTKGRSSTLELQDKCAKQAASFFKNRYEQGTAATYESHYSRQLDRCFAMVYDQHIYSSSDGHTVMMGQNLYDTFDGTDLGAFVSSIDTDKNSQSAYCFFRLPSGEEKKCSAQDEYLRNSSKSTCSNTARCRRVLPLAL